MTVYEIAFKKKDFFNGMNYMRGKGAIEPVPTEQYFHITGTTKKNIQLMPENGTWGDRISIKKADIVVVRKKPEGD